MLRTFHFHAPSPICIFAIIHQAGRTQALQQNGQNFKENTLFNEHPVLYHEELSVLLRNLVMMRSFFAHSLRKLRRIFHPADSHCNSHYNKLGYYQYTKKIFKV